MKREHRWRYSVIITVYFLSVISLQLLNISNSLKLNMAEINLARALVFEQSNFVHDAKKWFGRIVAGNSQRINKEMGFVLAMQKQEILAQEYWTQAGYSSLEFILWGNLARSRQQNQKAEQWYERALAADPDLVDAWYYLGILREVLGEDEAALDAFRQAAQREKMQAVGRADVYAHSGDLSERLGDFDQAVTYYEEALNLDDFVMPYNRLMALDGLGSLYLRKKNYAQAILLLKQAIELNPEYSWPYIRLGNAYYACCGDTDRAVTYLNQGLAFNPKNKWAYLLLGQIYQNEDDTVLAREMYNKALEIDPNWMRVIRLLEGLE